jgi:hypothetical protein
MISYPALFDELTKIAEEQDDNAVTKARLKRLAIAIPVAGAGMLVGHFGGRALAHKLEQNKGAIGDFARKHPRAARMLPMGVAGLAGAAGLAAAMRHKQIDKYVRHGDESKRPK